MCYISVGMTVHRPPMRHLNLPHKVHVIQNNFTSPWIHLSHTFKLISSSIHSFLPSTQTTDYRYRAAVRELVPQLCYLDDLRVEEDGRSCSTTMGEDWAILRNYIRDSTQTATEDGVCLYMLFWVIRCRPVNYSCVFNGPLTFVFAEETADDACSCSRPASARRPASSRSCVWPLSRPHTASRPVSANRPGVLSPPGSRPGSAESELATVAAETSALTHGQALQWLIIHIQF